MANSLEEYEKKSIDGLLTDPFQVNTFLKLYDFMVEKAIPKYRKMAFENMLKSEKHHRDGDIIFIEGSQYSETEKQSASKITKVGKCGHFVVFPNKGDIKKIKELEKSADKKINDIFTYDKKTYYQTKVDIKTVQSGESVAAIASHVKKGSEQADVVAIDIQGNISRWDLIKGIREGCNKDYTKRIWLNWKGQWYQLTKDMIHSDYLEKTIK